MILDIILTIGIEIKCGMIGYGVIIHIHLICGHPLDMIDGVTTLIVGITMAGIAGVGMGIMEMAGVGDNK
jgi:hypothetical protein